MKPMKNPDPGTPVFRAPDGGGRIVAIVLALIGLTCLVFFPVLKCDWVNYDDPVFVLQNSMVQKGLTGETLRWAFTSLYIYWQPLTWLSYMLEYRAGGASAPLFHATNLALHLASTAFLFLALRRMTGAVWRSAMVAALFALHPLHVETVAWISERKGALCGLFWTLALLAHARHAERPRLASALLVTACFALGLMAKSAVVTLPCALLLLDVWPLRRWDWFRKMAPGTPGDGLEFPVRTGWQLVQEKIPMFILAVVSSLLTVTAQKKMGAVISADLFSAADRFAIVTTSYLAYLRKLVWPVDLAVFYPNPGRWPAGEIALAVIVLLGITAMSLWQWRAKPYLLVGWLFFLGVLLPVSGILQTGEQLMADRYTYLPLTGVFVMVVWLAADMFGGGGSRRAVLAVLGAAALLFCAGFTTRQLGTWRNTRVLFEQAHAVTRDNYLADTVLGAIQAEAGNYAAARKHFEAALRIQPHYAETHQRMAQALAAEGKLDEAAAHLREALKSDAGNPDILLELATVWRTKGDWDAAVATLEQVLAVRPASAAALQSLAMIRQQQQNYPAAIQKYRESLRADPNRPEAMNNLAWILATHEDAKLRDGAEAVRLAEQACRLTERRLAMTIGTLAAAYAEAGRFPEAIKAAEEARTLADQSKQPGLAARNAQLAEAYRAGRAWREKAP